MKVAPAPLTPHVPFLWPLKRQFGIGDIAVKVN